VAPSVQADTAGDARNHYGHLKAGREIFQERFMSIALNVNGQPCAVDADPNTPLLWVIRDDLGLTGTKYGCGIAQCGACTVHVDGEPVRSCSAPVSAMTGRKVVTIEGLSSRAAKAVQKSWVELDVVQCGYCQSGQIMSATALLEKLRNPTDQDIDHAMAGNICRCATYQRIRAAIHAASAQLSS
jgi:isoquinoline 1-oxidoreductase alpha subunit